MHPSPSLHIHANHATVQVQLNSDHLLQIVSGSALPGLYDSFHITNFSFEPCFQLKCQCESTLTFFSSIALHFLGWSPTYLFLLLQSLIHPEKKQNFLAALWVLCCCCSTFTLIHIIYIYCLIYRKIWPFAGSFKKNSFHYPSDAHKNDQKWTK